jgi:predicted HicB family RNase H-like nuclease
LKAIDAFKKWREDPYELAKRLQDTMEYNEYLMEVGVKISESYKSGEGKKYIRVNKILHDELVTELSRTMH